MRHIVALDIATTSGLAILDQQDFIIYTTEHKGNPIELLDFILDFCVAHDVDTNNSKFIYEQVTHLKFVKVLTSLLQRTGFVYWSLYGLDANITSANLNTVRKSLGLTGKNSEKKAKWLKHCKEISGLYLTDNHSDAIALCLFLAEDSNLNNYKITLDTACYAAKKQNQLKA